MSKWTIENLDAKVDSDSEDADSITSDDSSDESISNDKIEQPDDIDDELNAIMATVDNEIKIIAKNVGVDVNRDEMPCGSTDSSIATTKKTQNAQATPKNSQPKAAPISKRRRSERISAMQRNDVENSKIITHTKKRSRFERSNASKSEHKKNKNEISAAVLENHPVNHPKTKVDSVSRKRKNSDERAKTILSTGALKYFTDIQPVAKENDSGLSNANINTKGPHQSGKCTICGERKQFSRGCVWNLKSHLERVCLPKYIFYSFLFVIQI